MLERLHLVPAASWAEQAATWIADTLASSPSARVSVALAGGNTPLAVYRLLVEEPNASRVPWPRLDLFFGDERAVPPDDAESNAGHALAALGSRTQTPGLRVIQPEVLGDLDAAARLYAAQLPARLDLLLLGMGEDGHTASLFPGSAAMREQELRVVAVIGPKPPPRRLTITPPVIAAARQVAVLVRGADKAAALEQALTGDWAPEACPAQLARHGHWFVDEAAGATLARR